MPIYIDLYQHDLSLAILQQSLATGEEMVITSKKQPIARVLSIPHPAVSVQNQEPHFGEKVENHRQTLGENRPRYDFSDLIGRLQWQGNALAEQQRLRDEW